MSRLHPIIRLLSNQEKCVLFHLSEELTSKQIAEALHISPETVDTHRRNIRRKLKLGKTESLLLYAVKHRDFLKNWADDSPATNEP